MSHTLSVTFCYVGCSSAAEAMKTEVVAELLQVTSEVVAHRALHGFGVGCFRHAAPAEPSKPSPVSANSNTRHSSGAEGGTQQIQADL